MALFIDFQQAYDKVRRSQLYEAPRETNVSHTMIRIIKLTLTQTMNSVRIAGELSEKFMVKEGLRQGNPLSPVLFNVALEKVINSINRSGLVYQRRHQCLAFGDDLVILTRNKKELR